MLRVAFACLLILLLTKVGLGQCLMSDFAIAGSACSLESIAVTNTADPGAYSWDFCTGDLEAVPAAQQNFTISGANGRPGFDLAFDNGIWYGIATGTFANNIYRLEFINGLGTNPSTIANLGNLGGSLDGPGQVRLFNEAGNWFGILVNTNSGDLMKLEFGNSLTNSITITTLVSAGASLNSGLAVGRDPLEGWIVVVTTSENRLKIYRLGFDILPPGINDTFVSDVVPSANNLGDVDLISSCDKWYAFAANFGGGNVYRFDFGSDLFSAPTVSQIESLPVGNTGRLRMVADGENNYLLMPVLDGVFYKLNFGASLESTPTVTNEGTIGGVLQPNVYSFAAAKSSSTWHLLAISQANGNVFRVLYPNLCSAAPQESASPNETVIYGSAGIYNVSLTTSNGGFRVTKTRQIAISSVLAPDISLTSQNLCANHDINFTSENVSGGITDYNWDFGDTNTSMLENPTHQYTSAGEYEVLLNVTASNGCNNIARQNITIYNEPVPDFNLPAAAPVCTNQEYFFTNNSAFDAGSNPTWQWEVNGNPVSTDQDLSYSISTSIQQDVKLIASIPGCSNEIMKSILSVEEGPLADFTFNNGCVETSILFINTTAGPVTGYSWDFGDTNVSSQTNGQNTYTGFGVYDVTLTASNAAGCNNSTTKPVTIYSKPQPDFSIDLPPFSCSGSPSQFNDLTPNPTDSNLSGWTWSFGDPSNGTSTTRNPLYTYSNAGSYDVQLDVITNFGCSNAVQKTINIAQSPPSGFSFNPACVNQGTVFTPNAINGINSWQWAIGTATYSSPSPTHVFSFPSTYNAQLTVTGANGCVAISSQPITVPAVPSLDFSASNLCEDQPVEFMDATLIGLDVPVSWAWEFGTVGTASGKNPSFTFDDPGSYPTRMTVTNQSGCKYSISKNISVVTSPTATFTATPQIGTAPLVVQLTNTTTNSNSQLWTINGTGETSTDDSPTFTFNNLGDYVIDLTVTNDQGCESTTSKTVSVVIPTLDLELTSLTVVPAATGEQRLLVSVKNNSNSTIAGPKLAVDIAGQAIINELLNVTLLPGATHTQMLATQVVGARGDLDYICVEIVLDGDFNKSNNKKCVGARSISVLDPYPNPSAETINLEWISQKSGNAEVYIFSSTGNKVFENAFSDFQPGLNRVAVAVDKLNPGIYYLLFVTGDSRRSFPVVIRR